MSRITNGLDSILNHLSKYFLLKPSSVCEHDIYLQSGNHANQEACMGMGPKPVQICRRYYMEGIPSNKHSFENKSLLKLCSKVNRFHQVQCKNLDSNNKQYATQIHCRCIKNALECALSLFSTLRCEIIIFYFQH